MSVRYLIILIFNLFSGYSGRTEFQSASLGHARRSVRFERRPSQRYSRRPSFEKQEEERRRAAELSLKEQQTQAKGDVVEYVVELCSG